MKSIELTEEHKSKLLEMCNKLFPNNKVDSLQFGTIKFLIDYYERKDPNNSKLTFGGWDEVVEIHWFEFCVKILGQKLLDIDDDADDYYDFIGECCAATSHPVDYLYEEFKKLK